MVIIANNKFMNESKDEDKEDKGRFIAYLATIGLAIIGFIHSEAWIIAIVVLLGPVWSFFVLTAIMTLLANGIILVLEIKAGFHFIEKLRSRVLDRQERANPVFKKIVNVSKVSGILILASFAGALTAAFLIHAFGYRRPYNYLLATAGSFLFVATWVSVYSGAIIAIKQIIDMV